MGRGELLEAPGLCCGWRGEGLQLGRRFRQRRSVVPPQIVLMLWLLALGLCLASGWFLARALTAGVWTGPRWASLLFEVALGSLFGPGLASVFYFALVRAGAATSTSIFITLIVFAGASGAAWWKLTPPGSLPTAPT